MSRLRVYLNGEDITDQIDLSRAVSAGPAHVPTEDELRAELKWSPCAVRGCGRTDALLVAWPDDLTFVYLCSVHAEVVDPNSQTGYVLNG